MSTKEVHHEHRTYTDLHVSGAHFCNFVLVISSLVSDFLPKRICARSELSTKYFCSALAGIVELAFSQSVEQERCKIGRFPS